MIKRTAPAGQVVGSTVQRDTEVGGGAGLRVTLVAASTA